jgi:hypothetical protein
MHTTPGKEGMMTPEALQSTLDYHRTLPVFASRPLTSGAVGLLNRWTGIEEWLILALMNPLLLVLSAVMLYALSLHWGAKPWGAWMAAALYLFSFPNLFAFVPPIYTYDEPLQFVLMLGALRFLPPPPLVRSASMMTFRHTPFQEIFRVAAFGLLMGLSFLARESGLILLPCLYFLYQNPQNARANLIVIGGLLWALGLWSLIKILGPETPSAELWQWEIRTTNLQANFQNQTYTIESLTAVFLVLAWPIRWALLLIRRFPDFGFAFLITLAMNTSMVLSMAKAREARLFALPLIILWPLLSTHTEILFRLPPKLREIVPSRNITRNFFLLATTLIILHWAWNLYQSTTGINQGHFFREYLSIYGISLALSLYLHKIPKEDTLI